MADRIRKSSKERVSLNCRISAETKIYLIHFAGEFGLGWAIEQIVAIQRQLATNSQHEIATTKILQ